MSKTQKPKSETTVTTQAVKIITPPQSVHVQNSMPKDSVPVTIISQGQSDKKVK